MKKKKKSKKIPTVFTVGVDVAETAAEHSGLTFAWDIDRRMYSYVFSFKVDTDLTQIAGYLRAAADKIEATVEDNNERKRTA